MQIFRDGRRIIGWIDHEPNGEWSYVFGKPSQKSYAKFYVATEQMAKERLLGIHNQFKETVRELIRR